MTISDRDTQYLRNFIWPCCDGMSGFHWGHRMLCYRYTWCLSNSLKKSLPWLQYRHFSQVGRIISKWKLVIILTSLPRSRGSVTKSGSFHQTELKVQGDGRNVGHGQRGAGGGLSKAACLAVDLSVNPGRQKFISQNYKIRSSGDFDYEIWKSTFVNRL